MSRASQAANSVLKAVEDVCALYRIPCFRLQSRALPVIGAKGKQRLMFFGEWRDDLGVKHTAGMADLLLAPQTGAAMVFRKFLWVECKSGNAHLSTEQQAFKTYVECSGMYFLECHDSADALIEWLKSHGVTR